VNRHTSFLNRQTCLRVSGFFIFAYCLCVPLHALAFKISKPAAGAKLSAGSTVIAHVDLGKDTGIVKVRYYWYSEQDEVLVEQDDSTATGSIVAPVAMLGSAEQEPAFGGSLKVPSNSIGPMRLLAVAEISRGRLGARSAFDEVIVMVEPSAALTTIDFETEKPLHLGRAGQSSAFGHVDSLGKIFELPVVADFADGVTRRISTPASGTSYTSSNDAVIKVVPAGLLQIVGNGKATITVNNRGKQGSLDVDVNVNDEPNEPPIADAGEDRSVSSGSRVKLSGLRSRDPEGEALYYSWSQVRGSKISLLDANNSETSFLAPSVSEPRMYRFKLRVTDKKGADSLPAFVDVMVEP
jgi:hypothetical protein